MSQKTKKSKLQSKKHSELSASGTERWWNCPGSVKLIRDCPPSKTTWYSAEGTVAHEVAQCILTDKPYKKKYFVDSHGDIVNAKVEDCHEFDVTEEMLDAVYVYVEFVQDLIKKHKLKPQHILIEKRVNLPGHDEDGTRRTGTADAILHVPMTCLIVADYKHGQGTPVATEGNHQLLNYMWGSYYDLDEDDRADIEFIYGYVVQPRGRGNGITSMMRTPKELDEWHDECLKRIERTKEDNAPLSANRKWCKFCPVKFNEETGQYCVEHRSLSHIDATVDFEDMNTLDKIDTITPERLAVILTNKKSVEEWFKQCEELAHNWVYKQDKKIPGFTKGFGNNSSEWKIKNELELSKELRKIFSPTEILKPSTLKTVTDLRNDLKTQRTQAKKAKQPVDIWDEKIVELESLIEVVPGKPKVVVDKGINENEFDDINE